MAKNDVAVPTEEQILKELKQREKRKQYMNTDKAKASRKAYMQKKYQERKAANAAIANLKESNPAEYERLMAKVQDQIAKES